jgi:heme-degrading monooxygenase HmoA
MIARIWRGAVRAADATAYASYIQQTGIEGYKATPGNRGAWMLWRPDGEQAEVITLSFWDSREAIQASPARTSRRLSSTPRMTASWSIGI